MRRTLALIFAVVLLMVALAPAAFADGHSKAYGKRIQDCFGAPYGQLLNGIRGDVDVHGAVVFPPAEGAKVFWQVHGPLC